MKKTFLSGLLLFVAAVTLSNCSKDETTDPAGSGYQLRATLEGTTVTWAAEDKIKVVNQNTPATAVEYTLSEGAGAGNGIFAATAPLSNGAKWAFYPSSAFGSCADNAFTFTLSTTQKYLATSFANEAYPMVAQSAADGTLAFKNLCGIIKLQLTGNKTVASIQLETAGEKIAGSASVAMNYTTAPALACSGTTTVTLQNINSPLSDTPTSFFFVVPAGEYAAGLTFTALDDKGAVINTHTTTKALTVIRSEVAELTPISTLHFPDPKFRAELVATYKLKLTSDQTDIDVNNEENKKLFANTTELEVQEKEITTLQGIEYFTALTLLDCYKNQLTSLDVTKNTALTEFACGSNQLTNLDVSKNTVLTFLYCGSNQLTSLDFSKNTALTKLDCGSNQLTSLDISQNTALTEFACGSNQLTNLDLSKNTVLTFLYCGSNQLTSLDLSQNTALTYLNCYENQLTSLDVTKNTKLTVLRCNENQLTSLDLSQNTALTKLDCEDNQLTSLDVSKNTALTDLYCYENQLTSLDVTKNTALTIFGCYNNRLTSLNISTCSMLTQLGCGNQHADGGTGETYTKLKLTCSESQKALISKPDDAAFNNAIIFEKIIAFPDPKFRAALKAQGYALTTDGKDIDVDNANNKQLFANTTKLEVQEKEITTLQGIEYFTALTYIDCDYNQLTSLDVSKNTMLIKLYCSENQLTSLDVSKNTALIKLYCSENQLTSLDVTKNTALTEFACSDNQLTSLDVSKNTALINLYCYANQLTSLDVRDNTALTEFACSDNQLTSLDVSKNTMLSTLYCYANQLTSLDIQPLTSLTDLICGKQLAGGAVDPSYSELKLFMTQAQSDANLGIGDYNEKVTRVVK